MSWYVCPQPGAAMPGTWLASLFSTTRLLCVQADAIFSAAVAAPSHAGAVAEATLSATPYSHTPPASTQPSGRSPVPSPAAEDASRAHVSYQGKLLEAHSLRCVPTII